MYIINLLTRKTKAVTVYSKSDYHPKPKVTGQIMTESCKTNENLLKQQKTEQLSVTGLNIIILLQG